MSSKEARDAYRKKNRDKINAQKRKYRALNLEKVRVQEKKSKERGKTPCLDCPTLNSPNRKRCFPCSVKFRKGKYYPHKVPMKGKNNPASHLSHYFCLLLPLSSYQIHLRWRWWRT